MRYNNKTLGVIALLGIACAANAQEDLTTGKKALERELTLEREYDPTVQDANKVNTLPTVKEPEAREVPIDYSEFAAPITLTPRISVLPSGNLMTTVPHEGRRGYLNFGIGNYLNIDGDAGYHILNTAKDRLNIWYSHRSTHGDVSYLQGEDLEAKQKINDNYGGLNYAHHFDQLSLKMGVLYGYSAFNYYGLPIDLSSSLPLADRLALVDQETNQVNQTIKANVGVESKEGASFGYLFDLDYIRFSHKYGIAAAADGPTENTIDFRFDVNKAFNETMRLGLAGQVEYFNYALPAERQASDGSWYFCSFENHAEVVLSPYYRVEGDNWHVKLGAQVMFSTGENSKVSAAPNVSADVEVAPRTQLYLTATGKLYSNSAYETSLTKRYIDPTRELLPSFNWLDGQVGIRSGVAPCFWFDLFAGYKITDSDVLFLPDNGARGGFANLIRGMDDIDTKRLYAGAELKYSYQQLFDIRVRGVYNHWTASWGNSWDGANPDEELEHAWGKPKVEITAGATIRPIDRLSIDLNYYLATDRYTDLNQGGVIKMDNINELSVTGAYSFNSLFGVYVKLRNLLFQDYELDYGYPAQGFSVMGGVNLNF